MKLKFTQSDSLEIVPKNGKGTGKCIYEVQEDCSTTLTLSILSGMAATGYFFLKKGATLRSVLLSSSTFPLFGLIFNSIPRGSQEFQEEYQLKPFNNYSMLTSFGFADVAWLAIYIAMWKKIDRSVFRWMENAPPGMAFSVAAPAKIAMIFPCLCGSVLTADVLYIPMRMKELEFKMDSREPEYQAYRVEEEEEEKEEK